jgi:RNA polymerase sigma-70 factor (ECF subfamily)
MTMDLEQTLAAAGKGDHEAWRSLIEAYSGRVYGLIFSRCRNGELAEEITQATFAKVVSKLAGYQEQGRFESWLFRIAMNQFRDELRRSKRQARPVDFEGTPPEALGHADDGPAPEAGMEQAEQVGQLREAIGKLPEADQELLELRYTAELTFPQIAETLDQPLGTVLARGHRALKKLRRMLSEETAIS